VKHALQHNAKIQYAEQTIKTAYAQQQTKQTEQTAHTTMGQDNARMEYAGQAASLSLSHAAQIHNVAIMHQILMETIVQAIIAAQGGVNGTD